MKKTIPSLLLALSAATAWGGHERNIAVDIYAPGAVRAEIAISSPTFKEARKFELKVSDGALAGGIYVPPGKENFVSVIAFDSRGEKVFTGSGNVAVDAKFTRQVDLRLEGKETKFPPTAKFGTNRLGLKLAAGPAETGMVLEATLFDAMDEHLPFKPDDLRWTGFPEKFELLPYSCFRNSLCIEIPDRVNADILACWRDVTCSFADPPDTRGPFVFVATGRTHTCALTIDSEIRCWGDNTHGQLRSSPTTCPTTTNVWPHNCSTVPMPIVCGAGEVCRYVSLSAGGERTCAVDTTGRLWCWGSQTQTTGEPEPGVGTQYNGEVEAFTAGGSKVTFTAVDVDLRDACAISSTRALYCWSYNQSRLDDQDVVNPGTQYKSVSVGKSHRCAVQAGGKFECFGSNVDGQIDGTYVGSPGKIHPGLQEILKRGGHRPAAGATSTCAQDTGDNTICWGSPSHWVPGTDETGGWMALRYSYATSLASNTDSCGGSDCTRICATGLGGDLFCGHWRSWVNPTPPLSVIPDPASDPYVIWNQMDVGPNHVCALDTNRDVWCFGTNHFGQFGTGTTSAARTDEPRVMVNH